MASRRERLRLDLATGHYLVPAANVAVIQLAVVFYHHAVADYAVLDGAAVTIKTSR